MTKKNELLPCPFCGEEVEEIQDDCGGAWIEHKRKPKNGGIQKCVLTREQVNTSSQTYCDWNTRHPANGLTEESFREWLKSHHCPEHYINHLAPEFISKFGSNPTTENKSHPKYCICDKEPVTFQGENVFRCQDHTLIGSKPIPDNRCPHGVNTKEECWKCEPTPAPTHHKNGEMSHGCYVKDHSLCNHCGTKPTPGLPSLDILREISFENDELHRKEGKWLLNSKGISSILNYLAGRK